jgi:hypothetical protein
MVGSGSKSLTHMAPQDFKCIMVWEVTTRE